MDAVPAELRHESQGVGERVPGAEVGRALPVELAGEAFAAVVTDRTGVDELLAVGADPEERRSLRTTGPLVQVAGVGRGAESRDVDVHRARGVGAVDQYVDAAFCAQRDDLGNGEN